MVATNLLDAPSMCHSMTQSPPRPPHFLEEVDPLPLTQPPGADAVGMAEAARVAAGAEPAARVAAGAELHAARRKRTERVATNLSASWARVRAMDSPID